MVGVTEWSFRMEILSLALALLYLFHSSSASVHNERYILLSLVQWSFFFSMT